jgi:enamine deaminase RidA (YjgF/YER057c/UK114 family)
MTGDSGGRPARQASPGGSGGRSPEPARTRRAFSEARWEPIVGYSRAVAAGDFVFVTGCTSIDGAEFVHEGDAFAQTRQAIANVRSALEKLGAGLPDVVRTRMFVTDISRWEEYGRAHGEAFAEVLPATSMIEVSGLIDPRMLVEVEAVAYKPGIGSAADVPGGAL